MQEHEIDIADAQLVATIQSVLFLRILLRVSYLPCVACVYVTGAGRVIDFEVIQTSCLDSETTFATNRLLTPAMGG
jgi:hypothetical protein